MQYEIRNEVRALLDPSVPVNVTRVRDCYGRSYRIGESDRDLLGHSRNWVLAGAWLAMLAVSAMQYGFGLLAPELATERGWGMPAVLACFLVWACCDAVVIAAMAWWRGRARVAPGAAVAAGGLCSAVGLATLTHAGNPALAIACYGVVGGAGAGLVYSTCLATVVAWYPDRPVRAGAVSGAFAYGSVPLIVAGGLASGSTLPLDVTVAVLVIAVLAGAAVLRQPPAEWWPADVDPRRWVLAGSRERARRHDRPALRHHTVGEVVRCPAARPLYLLLVLASAVALFDTVCLVIVGVSSGWGMAVAAGALAAFAAGSGAVRPVAVRLGARFGCRGTLRAALVVGAIAQLGLLGAATYRLPVAFVVAPVAAGAATGACYGLLPAMVLGYFGDRRGLPNLWLLYTAKAFGALLGAGLAGLLATGGRDRPAFAVTAAFCLAAVVLTGALRRPGLPRIPIPGRRGMDIGQLTVQDMATSYGIQSTQVRDGTARQAGEPASTAPGAT